MVFLLVAVGVVIVLWISKAIISSKANKPEKKYEDKIEFAIAEWIQDSDIEYLKEASIDYKNVYSRLEEEQNYMNLKKEYNEAKARKVKQTTFGHILEKVQAELGNQYKKKVDKND
jgi:hypothetical protein